MNISCVCSRARLKAYHAGLRSLLKVEQYGLNRIYNREQSTGTVDEVCIGNNNYKTDKWTNVTPRILSKIGSNLHNKKNHPLNLVRQKTQNYFYNPQFLNRHGTPMFAVFDSINPIVTVYQNFDSLLTPKDHISRSKTDTYYINKQYLLRSHTSAHQEDLIKMGFDAFLVVGDVYRRDEIDSSHYPVFHQMEGVRLFSGHEIFSRFTADHSDLQIFENGKRTSDKQETHSVDAAKLLEHDLKKSLSGLAHALFGSDVETRWVDAYFPFTHPSWELEIRYQGKWMEVLGCGIMEQKILNKAGANTKVGWAFGLGLERLAMRLFQIPDIRLFWSQDDSFLRQFQVTSPDTPVTYKPISQFPACINDISFWIPEEYNSNDFYDLVRTIAGDLAEHVALVDEFTNPKTNRTSHCYRINYRHMEKTFTKDEVNVIHMQISEAARKLLGVEVR